jgi:pimeloyl-ACP methyl ester carboxylesterase
MAQEVSILNFDNNFIAYKEYKSKQKNSPTVIFHHGLMSDMDGRKAVFIHEYCKKHDISCIRFDNLGHGKSSGKFTKQTIGNWVYGLKQILDNVAQGEIILVGSSMGGWVSLAVSNHYKDRLKGLLLLAPAPDFTEELIWQRMNKEQQDYMMRHGLIEFGPEGCKYPIPYSLIEEARTHLIFNGRKLNYNFPVHIIQGKKDEEVPYQTSLRLMEIIEAPQVNLKLLRDSRHNLSSDKELEIIGQSLGEIFKL